MAKSSTASRNDASTLHYYRDDVHPEPLLSAGEERDLAAAIARGDEEARARMIRANLRLVVRVARDYIGRGLSLDDLVGEGNLGLIRAVRDYDPAFGCRFSTYAGHWIKQAIRRALLVTTPTIRVPSHMANLLAKWERARRVLARVLDREPSREEVGDRLRLSAPQRAMVAHAFEARMFHLDARRGDPDCEARPVVYEIPDPSPGPEAEAEQADARREVTRRLHRLDSQEREIIHLRFGLSWRAPLTYREIGARLEYSREWVRRIERKALAKLGDPSPVVDVSRPATMGSPGGRLRTRRVTLSVR
jgi:RNA polymerase primary sigma factor